MNAITVADRVRIAQQVGMHEQYLYQCLTRRRPTPPDRCPAIERAAEARITVEELRPDVTWARIPDPTWPHPEGRPCIDVAGPPPPATTGA